MTPAEAMEEKQLLYHPYVFCHKFIGTSWHAKLTRYHRDIPFEKYGQQLDALCPSLSCYS